MNSDIILLLIKPYDNILHSTAGKCKLKYIFSFTLKCLTNIGQTEKKSPNFISVSNTSQFLFQINRSISN